MAEENKAAKLGDKAWYIVTTYSMHEAKTAENLRKRINTMNMQGKMKRVGAQPAGRRASWKKAIVTLSADSKAIELFEGMV